jgi:hypothetical protein
LTHSGTLPVFEKALSSPSVSDITPPATPSGVGVSLTQRELPPMSDEPPPSSSSVSVTTAPLQSLELGENARAVLPCPFACSLACALAWSSSCSLACFRGRLRRLRQRFGWVRLLAPPPPPSLGGGALRFSCALAVY